MKEKSIVIEKISVNNKELTIECGRWAKQADGAVVYKIGNLAILAAVCAVHEAKPNQPFFPLSVDYREKFYSAGRIPGSFFRREMRPSEHEVLISRLIDRSLRPLFPKGYMCEVQMMVEILSYDAEIATEGHAITAASAALMVSDIPFDGPIAGIRIGGVKDKELYDVAGEKAEEGDLDFIIGGNRESLTMIEGSANEISEEEMLATLDLGIKALQTKIEIQEKIMTAVNCQKRDIQIQTSESTWREKLRNSAKDPLTKILAIADKNERRIAKKKLEEEMRELMQKSTDVEKNEQASNAWEENKHFLSSELQQLEYEIVRERLAQEKIRFDGRKPTEIRDIDIELDVLANAHGSAVFTRGQTQSLGTVTLGTKLDNQRLDTLEGMKERRFLLHYNFPPFSTGEVRRIPGPSRREVGHGNLAYRAVKNMLPKTEEDFPYIIRVVSEILESNGSSSMATVCSTSLALMAAGVPIRSAVAGIAMGLMRDSTDQPVILSDIAGIEDHFGDMDFKLAGTRKGITAFQMDLKVKRLSTDIMRKAIQQARTGIAHILDKMDAVCDKARENVPANAPCISSLKIDPERIGELIGPGGKMIRTLAEKSGAEINVDDAGIVSISSRSSDNNKKAQKLIEELLREIKEGDTFSGVIRRIVDFGAFVEILPGREGLLHISKMARGRVDKVTDLFSEGEDVRVKVLAVDRSGKLELVIEDLFDEKREQNSRHGGSSGQRNNYPDRDRRRKPRHNGDGNQHGQRPHSHSHHGGGGGRRPRR